MSLSIPAYFPGFRGSLANNMLVSFVYQSLGKIGT